ncbi:DUF3219 domain-containing protein [Paenibacillus chitinolyticus]|uniref:DUF3219 domain-containing protein n=1 Tax=Paenibacillus chitinolyticus TaxID=79263 RepID=A0A410WV11_9BACL|nr:DUF3219 family protein [Paenibacillus chitinolyticus]MCY9589468.1 YkvR family protein [Paenibacillus chitinolyticus]MCY9599254.1 YkvR family protein [Paenibacillus chitinolyticus]QAV18215.1 DUF3219 domain-containing protein [Paenibacillus chitinolyticus]
MVKKMFLNGTLIYLRSYQEEKTNGLHKVSVDFNVTSEEYHDISTLLYSGTFDVEIPERDLTFRGTIYEYSTSLTNLYVKDQVGQYKLTLMEVGHEAKG